MRAPQKPDRYKPPPPVHKTHWFDYIAVVALAIVVGLVLFGMYMIVFGDPMSTVLIRK